MCSLRHCNKCILFDGRLRRDLYMWVSNVPNGPSAKFLVENGLLNDKVRFFFYIFVLRHWPKNTFYCIFTFRIMCHTFLQLSFDFQFILLVNLNWLEIVWRVQDHFYRLITVLLNTLIITYYKKCLHK